MRVLPVVLLPLLVACQRDGKPVAVSQTGSTLDLTAARGTIGGPDSAVAGWTTLRVEEREGEVHRLIAFHLPTGVDPEPFIAALDTAATTPLGAVALGGADGAPTSVTVFLEPGTLLVACLARDSADHRHATMGEWRRLEIHPSTAAATPPPGAITVEAADFAYGGAAAWPAGPQLVELRNVGAQDHLLLLAHLKPGQGLGSWLASEGADSVSDAPVGIARLGPGRSAYLPVSLVPGKYVLYCLIKDGRTGKLHLELGMLREITVGGTTP
jgi:hypothetical protein